MRESIILISIGTWNSSEGPRFQPFAPPFEPAFLEYQEPNGQNVFVKPSDDFGSSML